MKQGTRYGSKQPLIKVMNNSTTQLNLNSNQLPRHVAKVQSDSQPYLQIVEKGRRFKQQIRSETPQEQEKLKVQKSAALSYYKGVVNEATPEKQFIEQIKNNSKSPPLSQQKTVKRELARPVAQQLSSNNEFYHTRVHPHRTIQRDQNSNSGKRESVTLGSEDSSMSFQRPLGKNLISSKQQSIVPKKKEEPVKDSNKVVIVPGLKRRKLIKYDASKAKDQQGLRRDNTQLELIKNSSNTNRESLVKIEPYSGNFEDLLHQKKQYVRRQAKFKSSESKIQHGETGSSISSSTFKRPKVFAPQVMDSSDRKLVKTAQRSVAFLNYPAGDSKKNADMHIPANSEKQNSNMQQFFSKRHQSQPKCNVSGSSMINSRGSKNISSEDSIKSGVQVAYKNLQGDTRKITSNGHALLESNIIYRTNQQQQLFDSTDKKTQSQDPSYTNQSEDYSSVEDLVSVLPPQKERATRGDRVMSVDIENSNKEVYFPQDNQQQTINSDKGDMKKRAKTQLHSYYQDADELKSKFAAKQLPTRIHGGQSSVKWSGEHQLAFINRVNENTTKLSIGSKKNHKSHRKLVKMKSSVDLKAKMSGSGSSYSSILENKICSSKSTTELNGQQHQNNHNYNSANMLATTSDCDSGAPPSMPQVASHLTTVREVVSHPRGSKATSQVKPQLEAKTGQQAAVTSSVLLSKNIALSGKLATPAQPHKAEEGAGVRKNPPEKFFELRSHRTSQSGIHNNLATSKSTNQVIVTAPRHKSFGGPTKYQQPSLKSKDDQKDNFNRNNTHQSSVESLRKISSVESSKILNRVASRENTQMNHRQLGRNNSVVGRDSQISQTTGQRSTRQTADLLRQQSVQIFSTKENSFEGVNEVVDNRASVACLSQLEKMSLSVDKKYQPAEQKQPQNTPTKNEKMMNSKTIKQITNLKSNQTQFKQNVQRRQQQAKHQQIKQAHNYTSQPPKNAKNTATTELQNDLTVVQEIPGQNTGQSTDRQMKKSQSKRRLMKIENVPAITSSRNPLMPMPATTGKQTKTAVKIGPTPNLPISGRAGSLASILQPSTQKHSLLDTQVQVQPPTEFCGKKQINYTRPSKSLQRKSQNNINQLTNVPSLPELQDKLTGPVPLTNHSRKRSTIEAMVHAAEDKKHGEWIANQRANHQSHDSQASVSPPSVIKSFQSAAHLQGFPHPMSVKVVNNLGQRASRGQHQNNDSASQILLIPQQQQQKKLSLISQLHPAKDEKPRKFKETRQPTALLKMSSIEHAIKKKSSTDKKSTISATSIDYLRKSKEDMYIQHQQSRYASTSQMDQSLLKQAANEIAKLKDEIANKNCAYSSLKKEFDKFKDQKMGDSSESRDLNETNKTGGSLLRVLQQSSSSKNTTMKSNLNELVGSATNSFGIRRQTASIHSVGESSIQSDPLKGASSCPRAMPLKKRGDKKSNLNVNVKKTEETSYLLPLRARRKIIPQNASSAEVTQPSKVVRNATNSHETGERSSSTGGDIILGSGTTGGTSVMYGNRSKQFRRKHELGSESPELNRQKPANANMNNFQELLQKKSNQFQSRLIHPTPVNPDLTPQEPLVYHPSTTAHTKLGTNELRKRLYKPVKDGGAEGHNSTFSSNDLSQFMITEQSQKPPAFQGKPADGQITSMSSANEPNHHRGGSLKLQDPQRKNSVSQHSPIRMAKLAVQRMAPGRHETNISAAEVCLENEPNFSTAPAGQAPLSNRHKKTNSGDKNARMVVAKRRVEEYKSADQTVIVTQPQQQQQQQKGLKFSKHLNVRSKQSNFHGIKQSKKTLKQSEVSLTAKGELTGILEETSRKSEDDLSAINNTNVNQRSPDLHPIANQKQPKDPFKTSSKKHYIRRAGKNLHITTEQSDIKKKSPSPSPPKPPNRQTETVFQSTGTMFGHHNRKDSKITQKSSTGLAQVISASADVSKPTAYRNMHVIASGDTAQESDEDMVKIKRGTSSFATTKQSNLAAVEFVVDEEPETPEKAVEEIVNPFKKSDDSPVKLSETAQTPHLFLSLPTEEQAKVVNSSAASAARVETPIHPNQVVDGIAFLDVQDHTYKTSQLFEEAEREYGEDYEPIKVQAPKIKGTPPPQSVFTSTDRSRENMKVSTGNNEEAKMGASSSSITMLKKLQQQKKTVVNTIRKKSGPKVLPNPFFMLAANGDMKSTRQTKKEQEQTVRSGFSNPNSTSYQEIVVTQRALPDVSSVRKNSSNFINSVQSFVNNDLGPGGQLLSPPVTTRERACSHDDTLPQFASRVKKEAIQENQDTARTPNENLKKLQQIPPKPVTVPPPQNLSFVNQSSFGAGTFGGKSHQNHQQQHSSYQNGCQVNHKVNLSSDIFYTPSKIDESESVLQMQEAYQRDQRNQAIKNLATEPENAYKDIASPKEDHCAAFEVSTQQASIHSRRRANKQEHKFSLITVTDNKIPTPRKLDFDINKPDAIIESSDGSHEEFAVADEGRSDDILDNTVNLDGRSSLKQLEKINKNDRQPKKLLSTIPDEQASSPGKKFVQLDQQQQKQPIKFTKDFQASALKWPK